MSTILSNTVCLKFCGLGSGALRPNARQIIHASRLQQQHRMCSDAELIDGCPYFGSAQIPTHNHCSYMYKREEKRQKKDKNKYTLCSNLM